MKSTLQSLIKIIIIGCLSVKTFVFCHRQFPPLPPLPYYQNEDYYETHLVPPYHEPLSVFYPEENIHPVPVSYQHINYYSPPQLFHKNKYYNPPQELNPGLHYRMPQFSHYPTLKTHPHTANIELSHINYDVHHSPQTTFKGTFQKISSLENPHPPAFHIIEKEEDHQSYYQDDYSKNYQEEDYIDSYGDDNAPQTEPCKPDYPYQYFESPAKVSDNFDVKLTEKSFPCRPYFEPNFKDKIYNLKTPLTILPSRFPPRIEQIIEKIQNYFSTYNQQESQKPGTNQTSSISTGANIPATSTVSESAPAVNAVMSAGETETTVEPNLGESKETTVNAIENAEEVTEKAEEDTIQTTQITNEMDKEIPGTHVHSEKEPQIEVQNEQNSDDILRDVSNTTEINPDYEKQSQVSEQSLQTPDLSNRFGLATEATLKSENSGKKVTVTESNQALLKATEISVASQTRLPVELQAHTTPDSNSIPNTQQSEGFENETERYNSISTSNEVLHQNDKRNC